MMKLIARHGELAKNIEPRPVRGTSKISILMAVLLALAACSSPDAYRRGASISETIVIKIPAGFSQTPELASAISQAATAASDQKGVSGSVNVMSEPPGMTPPTPLASADPYLAALRDAQLHAAEIARLTGLPLGHITSVHQQTPPPQFGPQNRVMLEVDFGPDLSVVGFSPFVGSQQYNQVTNPGLRVFVQGFGRTADDARASANAYEGAVRKASAQFGLSAADVQIEGGAVNSGQ
jgi:hypothetical protein